MSLEQHAIIIILAPLLGALVISLIGGLHRRVAYLTLVAALAVSFSSTIATLRQVAGRAAEGPLHYFLGDWQPPYGIELVIDPLNALVLTMVAGVSLLVAIYSKETARRESPDRLHHYYTLFALLVAGLLGITATGDILNIYVLTEISALASYALLASGRGFASYATFKYLIMGTIGACFYLLGVGYLYIKTGTLNMAEMQAFMTRPALLHSESIRVAFILIMVGLWIKMAFFPLHGWLPNAYTRTSTTTSCLVAPLMTKVSVYVMIRVMFGVFTLPYAYHVMGWNTAVVWLASLAIVAGSIGALAQTNLKRMLTYIIVAEVGYMVGGAWLGNAAGLTGAIYHIVSDGLMTACLFMAVGAITFKTGEINMEAMRGVFRRMPVTAAIFVVGGLAMIGIPPTCGFFCKWYLISGGSAAGHYGFVVALLFSSLVNAVLFFRLFEIGYYPLFEAQGEAGHHDKVVVAEAPLSMLVPMLVTAAMILVVGLYTSRIVSGLIEYSLPAGL
ncbi:MAG: proton-conducting transporter membrane subunit [Deltaproteobacteria bacterium]|jgi:multicomponent Na+:H+ antiporter subunit D|nr:proton-conducting transporter membrane subunit [Deltaproteobacteria bacterium]